MIDKLKSRVMNPIDALSDILVGLHVKRAADALELERFKGCLEGAAERLAQTDKEIADYEMALAALKGC